MPANRALRVAVFTLALTLVCMGSVAWRPAWDGATTSRTYLSQLGGCPYEELRGWKTVRRWNSEELHGDVVLYNLDGYRRLVVTFENGRDVRCTEWNANGAVRRQWYVDEGSIHHVTEPPWLWNATNQAAPSMPAWMKDDERWKAILADQE